MSVKFGRPTELPSDFAVPKTWVSLSPNVPLRRQERPPLRDDDEGGDDNEETGDGDGDSMGEEDEDYEETSEKTDSKKRKREAVERANVIDKDFCTMSSCTKIVCTIGRLPKDEEASVIFPAIAWARTIRKVNI